MKKILVVIALLSTMVSLCFAEEWWLYNPNSKKCLPSDNIEGVDFSPSAVMKEFPECTVLQYWEENGGLMLDCKKSKLKATYIYFNSLSQCLRMKNIDIESSKTK